MSGFCQGTNFGTLSGTLPFSGKTKEPECLDFKGFQAPKEQGMRESNSHQKFWRLLSYHLTNPLYTIDIFGKASGNNQMLYIMYLQNHIQSTLIILSSSFLFLSPFGYALDRLVTVSCIHYCTSTSVLSTLSSSRGLTTCVWDISS